VAQAATQPQAGRRLPRNKEAILDISNYRNALRDRCTDRLPRPKVIAVGGDGGFTMLMSEIITAVAYKLPIKFVIIKNNTLGQIKWEQMVFQGNPEYQYELFPIDFVALARAVGAEGVHISDPTQCCELLDRRWPCRGPSSSRP
jgi:thiamine pyrophosphate-dependent acetolactate synthase large subunit-like protein